MSSSDEIAKRLSSIPNVDVGILGIFAGSEAGQALVDVDGERIRVPAIGRDWPMLGSTVRLLRIDKATLLLGQTEQRSNVGRVSATGSPKCTVEYPAGSGVSQLMGYPKGSDPVVGDIVLIDWASGGTVSAIVTAAAGLSAPTDPTPPPAPGVTKQTFTALDSGTYNNGSWWTNLVYASASTVGAWWYGTKIRDTIPDGARIQSIRINVSATRDSGNRPRLGTHGNASKPGGRPTINNLTAIPSSSGWVSLPTAFGDLLKTGQQLGVGADGAGYAIFRGTQLDGLSGALEITWQG